MPFGGGMKVYVYTLGGSTPAATSGWSSGLGGSTDAGGGRNQWAGGLMSEGIGWAPRGNTGSVRPDGAAKNKK